MDYSKHVSTRSTPQRERTPGRTDEVKNSAGGYVHAVDDWARLDRFLILGSEGGTYYINERNLTKENAASVLRLLKQDGIGVVDRVVEISDAGRAHKNDSALFVLAMCAKLGDERTRAHANKALPSVARTGTHLFMYAQFIEAFGGWGAGTRRAFSRWYTSKNPEKLARQLLKYRSRFGWSHRDILRLAHPVTTSEAHRAMFDVTCRPEKMDELMSKLPKIYSGYHKAQTGKVHPAVISAYGLSWEMLPTEWLKDEDINRELLETMPIMATLRQLGKMTANGTIRPLSDELKMVIERITDHEAIVRSRIHPMHYLLALKNYAAGHGFRGSLSWTPDRRIVTALNDGFYKAFDAVEPTGKSFLLGVDVSGSMSSRMGDSNLRCVEAAAAMSMVIARTEQNHFIHGFCSAGTRYYGSWRGGNVDDALKGFVDLGIGPYDSLDAACAKAYKSNFGGTDCAIPMLYAHRNNLMVDVFVVLTDSETWAGKIKPAQALQEYRRSVNPEAKLVVVGMTSGGFSIADPTDAGMLDVVGFDASVMPVISEFARS